MMIICKNLNNDIYVKLSKKGEQIYKNSREFFHKPNKYGYYRFQLWVFINIFGPYITMGVESPIKTNSIYIPFEKCEEVEIEKEIIF